ncbi:MAG: 2-oxo-4-hydroxy-4-carboxy-5-ureidoimidazoline decarboxylase [Chloroflexota bacterium]|nr:2-oxo-4-hydroxy-4-carboxy-5-ureidoimidazoline decarboxylase [Chloroflexota bacterium]
MTPDSEPDADSESDGTFIARMTPLFEGAPRFLARLANARPFDSDGELFDKALDIALVMPQEEQIELVNAHPRLGASPNSVSAMSYHEQGYDREPDAARKDAAPNLAAELARLNDAYEARFGFRYCTFVAGRSREALLPEMRVALGGDRDAELERALRAVVDIASDRHGKQVREGTRP